MNRIEHVKTYKLDSLNNKEIKTVEGILHLLDADPPENGERAINLHTQQLYWFKPVIISEREKIENFDKYIVLGNDNDIHTCYKITEHGFENKEKKIHLKENCRKILAFPEHFSPHQLQYIMNGKLKHGDLLLIECYYYRYMGCYDIGGDFDEDDNNGFYIKLNPAIHITLFNSMQDWNARLKNYPMSETNEQNI